MQSLNSFNRSNVLNSLDNYDLVVIGGGVTGAGIALDAANRGFKVCLLEKSDFASGTSSRSTKLIHGGLRYLKQLEFKLVHEVGVERALLHKNARNLVRPEHMLLPIIKGGTLGRFSTSLALWVYDWLANVPSKERRLMLNAKQTLQLEPGLNELDLLGGGIYYEYRTDDARLCTELIKTAVHWGAVCLNYMEAREFSIDKTSNKLNGVICTDLLTGEDFCLGASCIINAAGPFVDAVRKLESNTDFPNEAQSISFGKAVNNNKHLQLTKGVHVVVPHSKFPIKQSVYFDVKKDGRMIFAIPRGGITYLGTTDTFYEGDASNPQASLTDVEYIVDAANALFPKFKLAVEDIESTWAGVRPLIYEANKSASELSRKDEIFISEQGLISIAGGKLTGYRKMAERVLNLIEQKWPKPHRFSPCKTENLVLKGSEFESDEAVKTYVEHKIGEAKQLGLSPLTIQEWVYRYGKNTDEIIEFAFLLAQKNTDTVKLEMLAELKYGIEFEAVHQLVDFLLRRTGRMYFNRPLLLENLNKWGQCFAELKNLSENDLLAELAKCKQALNGIMAWKETRGNC